jgi:hypothetical protein
MGLLYLFAKNINPLNLFVGKHEFENNVDGFIELTVINAEQTRHGLRCRRRESIFQEYYEWRHSDAFEYTRFHKDV